MKELENRSERKLRKQMIREYRSAPAGLGGKELAVNGLFTALIAVGAFIKISIPVQPFPMNFTLQFFFVLLSGLLLGGRQAFFCVLTYLAVGLAGVPIFAAGGGPAYLMRPTFGFLLGFAGAAWVTGTVAFKMKNFQIRGYIAASFCGFAVMYLSGMVYFYLISNYLIHMPVSAWVVFVNCFLLTAGGDFILCILASMAAKRIRPMMTFLK